MKPQSKKAHKSLKFEDTDDKCICFNLRKAARVITQIYDEAFRPTGFRSTQMPLLVATTALGPVTVNRLAEAVVMDRTTLTRNLKPLEKQGLLRVETGNDQREREVVITDKGRQVTAQAYPHWEKVQAKVRKVVGEKYVSQLLKNLDSLLKGVKK